MWEKLVQSPVVSWKIIKDRHFPRGLLCIRVASPSLAFNFCNVSLLIHLVLVSTGAMGTARKFLNDSIGQNANGHNGRVSSPRPTFSCNPRHMLSIKSALSWRRIYSMNSWNRQFNFGSQQLFQLILDPTGFGLFVGTWLDPDKRWKRTKKKKTKKLMGRLDRFIWLSLSVGPSSRCVHSATGLPLSVVSIKDAHLCHL